MDKLVNDMTRKYIGRRVNKRFEAGFFAGTVVEIHRIKRHVYAKVVYDDGDEEDISVRHLAKFIVPTVNRVVNGFKLVTTDNPVKSKINKRVADATASLYTNGKVIFLDTPRFNTLHAMCLRGIPQDCMITPEYDVTSFESMKHEPHVLHGTLNNVIEQSLPESVAVLWADYECTWQGNKHVSPKDDMTLLVENKCLVIGGSVFITLSKRGITRRTAMETILDMWHTMRGFVLKARMTYQSIMVVELVRET